MVSPIYFMGLNAILLAVIIFLILQVRRLRARLRELDYKMDKSWSEVKEVKSRLSLIERNVEDIDEEDIKAMSSKVSKPEEV